MMEILVNMGAVTASFFFYEHRLLGQVFWNMMFFHFHQSSFERLLEFSQSVGTYKRCKEYQQK